MVCIYCDSKTKVTNSRSSNRTLQTWRRRECHSCRSTVTTREQLDPATAIQVQSHDALQPFLRDRLFLSLHRSLSHRKTALTDAGELTDTIMRQLYSIHTKGILKSSVIKETAHEVLSRFDPAAATHYQAHHQATS
jgi:transcriptional regulator NrdR family protein